MQSVKTHQSVSRYSLCAVGLCVLTFAPGLTYMPLSPSAAAAEPSKANSFAGEIMPLLAKHCTACHGGEKPKADLSLETFKDDLTVLKQPDLWLQVGERVDTGEMPPKGRPKLKDGEKRLLLAWIEKTFSNPAHDKQKVPGRVTIRRLNRAEYNNTVRDLLSVNFRPADDFPADDVGYGFDNIGDVLSMPPVLLEKYLTAAAKIVDRAFSTSSVRDQILLGELTPKNKAEATAKILEPLATRAYRRPITPEELERLLRFVELAERNGDSFQAGIKLAIEALLVSPHFLFRVELDPDVRAGASVHPVSDYQLASRLSYFLWASMPDDELFHEARKGTLRANIEAQVRRMLKDPKASGLVQNFAGQWLQFRNFQTITPDPRTYPDFDGLLRKAMVKETELFFEAIMREDRSVLDFLDADFTFVNERLARHYVIDGIEGAEFQRIKLTGGQRGGILTHASVLTLTSNPTRTSPAKRGKWILENLLGATLKPPPPDAGELSDDKQAARSGSLRTRMETHRRNATCASCHQAMDPLGFGLENYNGIGAWRDKEGDFEIDSSGTLPNGRSFKGPAELRSVLKGKTRQFSRCLSEKMLTYALGRGLERYDRPAVSRICAELATDNYKFSRLVLAIVKSDPFQMRRGP